MVVVADTSPINYLIQISCIHILPALYQKVIVPRAVIDELGHRNAPEAVASWASQPPSWISVSDLQTPVDDNELRKLDSGEIAAISLAVREYPAVLLLMDDAKARSVAKRLGVATVGTLGILRDAAGLRLISLHDAVTRLRATSFRAPQELLNQLAQQAE
ncbi:MAG: DUF3368 domain-containing protein [Bryobacteraceae bacterium]